MYCRKLIHLSRSSRRTAARGLLSGKTPAGDGYAKMWLGPPVDLVYSFGFSPRERRAAVEIVIRERAMMEKAWHAHFGT